MNPVDIQFQEGVFQRLRVTARLHLGQYSLDIPGNAVVEFDGQTLKYGGQTYPSPQTLGAVRSGWLVPVDAPEKVGYVPQPAGVSVHSAVQKGSDRGVAMKVDPATADESVVGSLTDTTRRRDDIMAAHMEQQNQVSARPVIAPGPVRLPPPKSVEPGAPAVRMETVSEVPVEITYKFASNKKVSPEPEAVAADAEWDAVHAVEEAESDHVVEPETVIEAAPTGDGRPVARLKSPTTIRMELKDERAVSEAVRKLESGGPVRPQKLAAVKPPVKPEPKTTPLVIEDEAEEEVGVPISQTLHNGATGDVAEARVGDTLEELLPDAASSGIPTTFQWDKKGHWRDRVKRAYDMYRDRPDIIQQICAVETATVVKHLQDAISRR